MAQPFVQEITPLLVDAYILSKAQRNPVSISEIERDVKNWNLTTVPNLNVRSRVEHLQQTGHAKLEGENVRVTDDGRQDIQKLMPVLKTVTQTIGVAGTTR